MDIFLELFFTFLIYSFLGWIIETIYCSFLFKKFVNRGFLNGPYCPIYGFSVVLIIQILSIFIDKIKLDGVYFYVLVFFLSIIVSTVIELITGILIEKIFKMRLWDYSDKKFNFLGHVALEFSLYWGFLAFVLINFINPFFTNIYNILKENNYNQFLLIPLFLIFLDFILSSRSLFNFNKILKNLKLIKVGSVFDSLIKYKRILKNFIPDFYNFHNIKFIELRHKIIKFLKNNR